MTETRPKKRITVVRMTILALLIALIILLGFTPLGLIPLGFINVTILCIPVIIGTLYLGWKSGLLLGFCFGAVSFCSALIKPSALVSTLMAKSPIWVAAMSIIPRLCIPLVAWFVYDRLTRKTEEQAQKRASMIFGSLASTLFSLAVITIMYLCRVISLPPVGETIAYVWSRNNVLLIMGCIVLFATICGLLTAVLISSRKVQTLLIKQAPAAVTAVCGSLTNTVLYLGMMLLFYVICGIDTASVLALIAGTALIAGLSEAAAAAILVPPILLAIQKIKTR